MLENFKFDASVQFPQSTSRLKIIEKLRSCQITKEKKPSKKKDLALSRFIKEHFHWKRKIKVKKKQIISLKTSIKNLETNHSLFIAIFATTVVLSLIYLFVLTPLSLLGLVLKAPIWWVGIMISLIGVGIGGAAIKSILHLNQKKEELDCISEEKKYLKFLISKKNIIRFLFNYDRLCELNMISLSRQEHLDLIQGDVWKHPFFEEQIEHLEQALHYTKNCLDIPKELNKKIQSNFIHLMLI